MELASEPPERKYQGGMLTLAREACGLTQSDLAQKMGVTQGKISKIEDGLLCLSNDDVKLLIDVLGYPEEFYLYREDVEASSPSLYRRKSDVPASLLRQGSARMAILRIQLRSLLKAAHLDSSLPFCDPDEYRGGAIAIAQKLRAFWKVPSGPIKNVTALIERAGCPVIDFDFGTLKIDACSETVDGVPVIYVNANLTPARRRLTLMHELGHLVMHRFPTDGAEQQAFDFAAEFLMPRDEIASMYLPFSMDKLARLKLHWKVSMQALLKNASRIGVINTRKARYYWMLMGKQGYREREPFEGDIPHEVPTLWKSLVRFHMADLDYTMDELSRTMLISVRELEQTVASQSGLRIIK